LESEEALWKWRKNPDITEMYLKATMPKMLEQRARFNNLIQIPLGKCLKIGLWMDI